MDNSPTAHVSSQSTDAGQPGYSGKRVTIAVVVLLLMCVAWLGYTLWVYDRIDTARDKTNIAWRSLVEQLDQRYRDVERFVATGVDNREIEMEFGESFRLGVDRFRTTAQPADQFVAARRLEELLSGLDELPAPADDLIVAVERLNSCLVDERAVLGSPGGRFLSVFLQFSEPIDFELAE